MQQTINQFYPIFTTKSDGQHVVNVKNRPLRNGPSEEQLDEKPNAHGQRDYYREIPKDDAKHIDWRKKLGGMLLRELGEKPYEGEEGARRIQDGAKANPRQTSSRRAFCGTCPRTTSCTSTSRPRRTAS
jgi:hypothetical protein